MAHGKPVFNGPDDFARLADGALLRIYSSSSSRGCVGWTTRNGDVVNGNPSQPTNGVKHGDGRQRPNNRVW